MAFTSSESLTYCQRVVIYVSLYLLDKPLKRMKKFIFVLLAIVTASSLFSFFILFEGKSTLVASSWQIWTRDKPFLPFSAYNSRRETSSDIILQAPNKVEFHDNHLFWRGSGAQAQPELTHDGRVVRFIMISPGSGYSDSVKVKVSGIKGSRFQLGTPQVKNGQIVFLPVIRSSEWHQNSLAFVKGEQEPFSGISERILPSGQIIEEIPYLMGKLHGTCLRYTPKGIPVHSLEYNHGQKDGTHIYWFQDPIDPDDYVPQKSSSGEILPSLWSKVREDAKKKFGRDLTSSGKANRWIVQTYRLRGGEFQVSLLEHWNSNRKHGLFEGFDFLGNKTFKDEYSHGLRIKHKTFDKTKG